MQFQASKKERIPMLDEGSAVMFVLPENLDDERIAHVVKKVVQGVDPTVHLNHWTLKEPVSVPWKCIRQVLPADPPPPPPPKPPQTKRIIGDVIVLDSDSDDGDKLEEESNIDGDQQVCESNILSCNSSPRGNLNTNGVTTFTTTTRGLAKKKKKPPPLPSGVGRTVSRPPDTQPSSSLPKENPPSHPYQEARPPCSDRPPQSRNEDPTQLHIQKSNYIGSPSHHQYDLNNNQSHPQYPPNLCQQGQTVINIPPQHSHSISHPHLHAPREHVQNSTQQYSAQSPRLRHPHNSSMHLQNNINRPDINGESRCKYNLEANRGEYNFSREPFNYRANEKPNNQSCPKPVSNHNASFEHPHKYAQHAVLPQGNERYHSMQDALRPPINYEGIGTHTGHVIRPEQALSNRQDNRLSDRVNPPYPPHSVPMDRHPRLGGICHKILKDQQNQHQQKHGKQSVNGERVSKGTSVPRKNPANQRSSANHTFEPHNQFPRPSQGALGFNPSTQLNHQYNARRIRKQSYAGPEPESKRGRHDGGNHSDRPGWLQSDKVGTNGARRYHPDDSRRSRKVLDDGQSSHSGYHGGSYGNVGRSNDLDINRRTDYQRKTNTCDQERDHELLSRNDLGFSRRGRSKELEFHKKRGIHRDRDDNHRDEGEYENDGIEINEFWGRDGERSQYDLNGDEKYRTLQDNLEKSNWQSTTPTVDLTPNFEAHNPLRDPSEKEKIVISLIDDDDEEATKVIDEAIYDLSDRDEEIAMHGLTRLEIGGTSTTDYVDCNGVRRIRKKKSGKLTGQNYSEEYKTSDVVELYPLRGSRKAGSKPKRLVTGGKRVKAKLITSSKNLRSESTEWLRKELEALNGNAEINVSGESNDGIGIILYDRETQVDGKNHMIKNLQCVCGMSEEPKYSIEGFQGIVQCGCCGSWSHLRCIMISVEDIKQIMLKEKRLICCSCLNEIEAKAAENIPIALRRPDKQVARHCDDDGEEKDKAGEGDLHISRKDGWVIPYPPLLPVGVRGERFLAQVRREHGGGSGRRPHHTVKIDHYPEIQRRNKNKGRPPLTEKERLERARNVDALCQGIQALSAGKRERNLIDLNPNLSRRFIGR